MKLYDNPISGNCYKVRLLLAFIDKDYRSIPIDSLHGETQQPAFLAISPRGLIPVLEDDKTVIHDSMAILVYLARRYAPSWIPSTALEQARVMEWMAIAADELHHGAAMARRIHKLGVAGDLESAQKIAIKGLQLLEAHLAYQSWLAGNQPSIADVACYPYVALVPEGGISLASYAAITAWIKRIQQLPGYVSMSGL